MAEPLRITVNKVSPDAQPPTPVPPPMFGAGREALGTLYLEVGGQWYKDILQFTLRRSTEETAGAGHFVLSWPGAEKASGIEAFSECAKGRAYLDGQLACTFRIAVRTS